MQATGIAHCCENSFNASMCHVHIDAVTVLVVVVGHVCELVSGEHASSCLLQDARRCGTFVVIYTCDMQKESRTSLPM